MRAAILLTLWIGLCSLMSGCSSPIELVGYGCPLPNQHGLDVRLLYRDRTSATEIHVTNTTGDILSLNQSPMAMHIRLIQNGQEVMPVGRIMHKLSSDPEPDDFVILAPGQTRILPVPLALEGGQVRTFSAVYEIGRGECFDVEVQLNPYSGNFTEASAAAWLDRFKVPGHLDKPLRMNTLAIRRRHWRLLSSHGQP